MPRTPESYEKSYEVISIQRLTSMYSNDLYTEYSLDINRLELKYRYSSNRRHRRLSCETRQDKTRRRFFAKHWMHTCLIYSPYINILVRGMRNGSPRWSWIISRNWSTPAYPEEECAVMHTSMRASLRHGVRKWTEGHIKLFLLGEGICWIALLNQLPTCEQADKDY